MFNPFQPANPDRAPSRKPATNEGPQAGINDPLDVEDLLIRPAAKAKVLSDGTLVSAREGNRIEGGTQLLKERVWGATWWERDPSRLDQERQIMKRAFPKFRLAQAEADHVMGRWTVAKSGTIFWLGRFRTHSGTIYTLVLNYPPDFPYSPIAAYVVDPDIQQTPHRYSDGRLCLYSNDHGGGGQGFEANISTAAQYAGWVSAWLHAYEIWFKTQRWPQAPLTKRGVA